MGVSSDERRLDLTRSYVPYNTSCDDAPSFSLRYLLFGSEPNALLPALSTECTRDARPLTSSMRAGQITCDCRAGLHNPKLPRLRGSPFSGLTLPTLFPFSNSNIAMCCVKAHTSCTILLLSPVLVVHLPDHQSTFPPISCLRISTCYPYAKVGAAFFSWKH